MSELYSTGKDNGLGWVLTLLDTLMHEYGSLSRRDARHLPLAEAFAYYAAIAARYDHTPAGPTYEEAEMIAEIEAAREGKLAWQA